MGAVETEAEFEVGHVNATGLAEIYTCAPHLAHTIRTMWDSGVTPVVAVKRGNRDPMGNRLPPFSHTCKGCLEDWPES